MIGTPQEEKQKDEVLQKINDALDKVDWGANGDRLVLKVVFTGKFNITSICGNSTFDKKS